MRTLSIISVGLFLSIWISHDLEFTMSMDDTQPSWTTTAVFSQSSATRESFD